MGQKNGKKIYIQVSLTVIHEDTRKREFGNLMLVDDSYPKYVVTLNDMIIGNNDKGIQYVNLKDFLDKEI